nr:hypothetical protein [Tanacetum cinerariifolium]
MTCHPPIRPAATCTVPRIQLLVASHRHVAASYWTAASDLAPTSAPVSAGQRRSTPSATGQRRRSTTVNAAGHRSTAENHGGDRRSTVVGGLVKVGHGPGLDRFGPGLDRVWAGSRSGLGRVWIGSGPPRVSHVCTRVSHVCPRGIHVDAYVDNMPYVGIDP